MIRAPFVWLADLTQSFDQAGSIPTLAAHLLNVGIELINQSCDGQTSAIALGFVHYQA